MRLRLLDAVAGAREGARGAREVPLGAVDIRAAQLDETAVEVRAPETQRVGVEPLDREAEIAEGVLVAPAPQLEQTALAGEHGAGLGADAARAEHLRDPGDRGIR
ncbi:MAG: hypothetical protein DI534_06645 [Leifsonia xyli]|nr:MAG: hypothetical protein DI534_06645 [Leifsonia xyli]